MGFAAALSSALFLATLSANAQDEAQDDTGTEVVRQDPSAWMLDCESGESTETRGCQISQSVSVRETGQRIVMVVIQKDPEYKTTHMLLALPHRIYLPSGVDLAVDTYAARRVAFETCDERACYASAQIDDEFVAELRSGRELEVVFHNLANKPVTVPMSLLGFTRSYDQLP